MTIDWVHWTPVSALIGGTLIGLAAVMLMLFLGQIAGISSIAQGIIWNSTNDRLWRLAFALGLVVGGGLAFYLLGKPFIFRNHYPLSATLVAGLMVGVGTGLGYGCTSGHGVCGLARLSRRSMVATLLFVSTGMLTVWLMRHVFAVLPS